MESNLGKVAVNIETNIKELSDKTKRLQQLLAEAEVLIQEINEFELKATVKILDS